MFEGARTGVGLAVTVVADRENGGGEIIDCPEGADDVACSGIEKTTGKAKRFIGLTEVVAESGFAAGQEDVGEVG